MSPLAGSLSPLGRTRVLDNGLWGLSYAGCTGASSYAFSLGGEFTVGSGESITITRIGMFSPGGSASLPDSGWGGGGVRIAATTDTSTFLVDQAFTYGSPGTLDTTKLILYKDISSVTLTAGTYRIWAYGYGSAPYYYHRSTGDGAAVGRNTVNGKVTWTSGSFYSGNTLYPGFTEAQDYTMGTFYGS